MDNEFRSDVPFEPWGPLISPNYVKEPITNADIIVASVVWALTLINAIIGCWLAIAQTKSSKYPLRSTYVWMIWLELGASFIMGFECYLHLLKFIKPSFSFYFTILFLWCIQVQLLLQIIINRIRVIVPDRKRSWNIMVATATFVTAINISVFCIWIPARLQISKKYELINQYWDRFEKGLYLFVDAMLNWYFLKTVKANLIQNGLTKYNKLVKFNQRIVMVSLLMDVMIIGAMSIPNSFVYIQFHPLAYLVKLNIEMTMANLIKRIAVSASRRAGHADVADEFKSSSNLSTSGGKRTTTVKRSSIHELASIISYSGDAKADRTTSFTPIGNQIKSTQTVTVTSEPSHVYANTESRGPSGWGRRGSDVEITGNAYAGSSDVKGNIPGIIVEEAGEGLTPRSKSLDSSVKSADVAKRGTEDSDDEAALVGRGRGWGREPI